MTRDAKELRVTLDSLLCTNASGDSGANLEIFGKLEARGVFIDGQGDPQPGFQQVLWEQTEDAGGINIAPNTVLPINKAAQFLVFERDFLWIGGKVVEEDDFSDDVLGDGFRKVPYNDIKNEMISVGFNNADQEVVARYAIEVLNLVHT
ncbi:hypothetical protein Rhe02_59630 [Rhizocola hellebori]|uniref:Uncharacterized protein n=1 Tax=Rhizocola hellebori TaxID=1392758 RepID=A0A8J3QEM0_9ACTN|nr:hypothetical protein [Rhizocola hellebori]GIH07896.1 hypothetical protein Rhe02_59630 [Rhizocola hellebori]